MRTHHLRSAGWEVSAKFHFQHPQHFQRTPPTPHPQWLSQSLPAQGFSVGFQPRSSAGPSPAPAQTQDICAEQIHPAGWATQAPKALCKYFPPHNPIFHIPLAYECPWHLLFLPLWSHISHCWDGKRNTWTGVGCVGDPREGLAFFVSIF